MMAGKSLKRFVVENKEVLMFLVGFGVMHYGWYNLQRNSTLNKALKASHDKELAMAYKRLENEINENWPDQQPQLQHQQQQEQTSDLVTAAAAVFTGKSSNTN